MKRIKNKSNTLSVYFKSALFSLLAFCLVSIILLGNLFFEKQDGIYEINIPSYRGMSEDDISDIDGVVMIKDYVYSNEEKGRVISQSYVGKTKIAKDKVYSLYITVSLGEQTLILPNLAGMSAKNAENKLEELGLRCEIRYVSGDYLADVVLYHIPRGDCEVRANDKITLYVSRGNDIGNVKIPEFEGMDINDAVALANKLGINIGKITYIYTEDMPEGCVASQSMPKGILADGKCKIDFCVAKNTNYSTKDKKESRVKLWMDRKREE